MLGRLHTVRSADGTPIAYEELGSGPCSPRRSPGPTWRRARCPGSAARRRSGGSPGAASRPRRSRADSSWEPRARSPLRCVRRHELSPNAPERRSPPCDELSSAPRGPTRGARHRLPSRPQARAVIAGGRPAGDHEEPLAVVGLDLEHDAGAGVVHRADVPLGEQDASAPPGAAPQPDSGSTSCASAASPRRHTVARSPPPDGYR